MVEPCFWGVVLPYG